MTPMTEGEALAVDVGALHDAAKFLAGRYSDHDGWVVAIRAAASVLTAAQQPVQEGGGERKGCGDPTCGCDWPSFTEPMEALRFLSGRMKYAGIAEGVARSYARDIDDILAKYDTAPPSAPVGSDDPAYRAGYAQGVDDSRKHECACTRTEALTQQPAQAAPGDGVSLIAAERRRQVQVEGWAPEHDDEHTDGAMAAAAACYASFAALSDVRRSSQGTIERMLEDWPWDAEWWKPSDRIRDLTKAGALIAAEIDRLQRATPPGDDAAGGG